MQSLPSMSSLLIDGYNQGLFPPTMNTRAVSYNVSVICNYHKTLELINYNGRKIRNIKRLGTLSKLYLTDIVTFA